MKTIFKTLGLGALFAALMVVGGVTVLAQDACNDLDAINALDAKIRADFPKVSSSPLSPEAQSAVDNGKAYLEKYGACDVTKDFSGWLKGRIPVWEKTISDAKGGAAKKAASDRYDSAVNGKNWDEAFAAGADFASKYPDEPSLIHKYIPLALIGYSESYNKNYKFNANSEKYAKISLDLLKSGNAKPKPNGHFGAFQFECNTREDCISLLTYAMGFMTYYGDNNKQAALPYYYEVTKIPGQFKNNAAVYGTIGDYYFDTVKKMADEVKTMIADQKDTDPDDVKAKKEADIKAKIALLNGYAERAMDAYSRSYTIAKADPKTYGQLADNVYKTIQTLYNLRFQKKEGVDEWIAAAVAKPFPDPTSAVTPVADSTSSGESSVAPTTTKPVTTTPVSTPIKPVSTPTKPAGKVGASKIASSTDALAAKSSGKGVVKH